MEENERGWEWKGEGKGRKGREGKGRGLCIGKQSGESGESVLKKKKKAGFAEKEGFKPGLKERRLMRVVSRWNRCRTCHSRNWVSQDWGDWFAVDGGKPGVDSRDEGKHTGRNDLLFVEKMM